MPTGSVPVVTCQPEKMSGGRSHQQERFNGRLFPPIELDDLIGGNPPGFEVGANTERHPN